MLPVVMPDTSSSALRHNNPFPAMNAQRQISGCINAFIFQVGQYNSFIVNVFMTICPSDSSRHF